MKPAIWLGSSKEDLMAFPEAAKRMAGYQVSLVQAGLDPQDWKPMPTIGAGVREIRIRETSGAFRVIYLAHRAKGVYVLHAFQKKTEKTSLSDLRLAQERLKLIPR
jgi:phage-related protein